MFTLWYNYGIPSDLFNLLATGSLLLSTLRLDLCMLDIWLVTFNNLLLFLYLHIRAARVMSDQLTLWSDKVQTAIKKLPYKQKYW